MSRGLRCTTQNIWGGGQKTLSKLSQNPVRMTWLVHVHNIQSQFSQYCYHRCIFPGLLGWFCRKGRTLRYLPSPINSERLVVRNQGPAVLSTTWLPANKLVRKLRKKAKILLYKNGKIKL